LTALLPHALGIVAERTGFQPCTFYIRKNSLPIGLGGRARGEAGNQRPWPADKVERWSIERLIPYAKNARTHTDGDLELAGIMAERTAGLTNPDDAPAVPEHPVSVAGDLWLLGRHRLLCGDSTVATDVERVLGGVEPPLMVTDPPYGVEYDASWRSSAPITRRRTDGAPGMIGGRALGKVQNDDRADWREAWTLFPGSVAYIWHAGTKAGIVPDGNIADLSRPKSRRATN
jgi:hypothetical protein